MTEQITIGNRQFKTKDKTYVMGILNVTPDSFSDGGKWNHMDQALFHVEEMIAQGMDILDIGGESTRPGYTLLESSEEIQRVLPVIEKVKARFDIPVSLDTYKSKVAEAGLSAGADMINDIWGLKYDPDMAAVIAAAKKPSCLMHNRPEPKYKNFLAEVVEDLRESVSLAEKAGIDKNQIILDPGVGFGKSYEENLSIMKNINELKQLECPILLGCSRKSVIGLTLDLPVEERLEGTLATTIYGAMMGCSFVRVHDIKENVRALRMLEAINGM